MWRQIQQWIQGRSYGPVQDEPGRGVTRPRNSKSRERHEFVVIGLGRFGSNVAETLVRHGHDVLGIDNNAERVQHLSHELPHVIQMDATNAKALEELGIGQFETGVVSISNDFESNLLATVLLRRFGVRRIITKAATRTQKTILLEVGADEVILPEHEAGVHLGLRLCNRNFVDYLELGDGIGIVEIATPPQLCGHTLAECQLRQQLGLTVIAVHRGQQVIASPGPEFAVEANDVLVVVGRISDAENAEFARLRPRAVE
jgi:trk system potassium uptake protein TrkA